MNFYKKRVVLIVLFLCFGISNAQITGKGKANRDTDYFNYEIECVGAGKQGKVILKVWSYARRPKIAIEQAKKNAVHGVLFKGYESGLRGCISQRAIVVDSSVEEDKKAFFDDFFGKGGVFLKYVSTSSDSEQRDIRKVTRGRLKYKIGIIVTIHKDVLRKYLEKENIIRGLSSGF